jgi:hypothetical protein
VTPSTGFTATTGTPVLWLVGALGTGKSDTSYHLFSRLFRSGMLTGRLDLDDVGMCYPAPEDDPHNHRVKASAMAATWSVFRDHGARCLVLSGGVTSSAEVDLHKALIPDADWSVVRLRIGAAERRRRTAARGQLLGQDSRTIERSIEAGTEDEATLESSWPSFADVVIDTDGLNQQRVVDRVLEVTGWPGL